ncbi:alpha/beta hydrolase [Alteromonas sp. 14N.309.X.WAT.G.H12]|uniref:alpha/beta hydrolase n=1 Tax=Alteromonas sp. 14N.309.X.WAT.G.H12 TaxID=3120824 RepID=UPI002FCEC210
MSQIIQQSMDLYPQGVPEATALPSGEFLSTNREGEVSVVAPDKPTLTVVAPPKEKRNGSGILLCPGGGYERLAMDREGFHVAQRLVQYGITVFVLKYRVPSAMGMQDPSIGPLQDAQQAMWLIHSQRARWAIDTSKVGVMGFSAGGHLAATLSTWFKKPLFPERGRKHLRPAFQILIYPVISMEGDITHQGCRHALLGENPTVEKVKGLSVQTQVTTNTPPAYMVHANDDKSVPVANALCFHQALIEKRVPVQLLLLPKGGHGFGLHHPTDWFANMMEWLTIEGYVDK